MLARLFLIAIALLAIPVVPALAVPFSGLSVNGAQIFGFDSATPGIITSTLTLTQPVTSIAMLPATGELYGVANQNGTVFSPLNIYTINTVTGAETLLAVTSVPVNGSVDGISFDPVTDQLRIIVRPSSGGNPPTQNFLANPVSGATVIEGPLVYTAGDPNAGATPIAAPIAYTNQDQLYGIDLARRLLFRVDQPSTGMASTVGPLGIQLTSSFGGFDIVGASDAFMTTLGIDFYSVDLSTGAATLIGTTVNQIRDIAQVQIGPVQSVPEPTSMSLLGLSLAGMFALRRRRAIQTTSPE